MVTVLLLTGFSILTVFQITPRYTTTARLMIEADAKSGNPGTALGEALGGGSRSQIFGEIEVMRSDRLISATVDKLGLMADPEFNSALKESWLTSLLKIGFLEPAVDWITSIRELKVGNDDKSYQERQRTIQNFRQHLDIRPPGVSNVVAVKFESEDPQKAARLSNAFIRIYADDHLRRRLKADTEKRAWLEGRTQTMKQAVVDADKAVGDFLASRRLAENGRNPVVERQFADVSRQLSVAKASYEERRTRLEQVYQLRDSDQGLAAVKEIRNSPLVQRLQGQAVTILRRLAELGTRLGNRHPKMVNLHAELKDVRNQIQEEHKRIVQELENEVGLARSRVMAITTEQKFLDSKRLASEKDRIQQRQLQREAETNQRMYVSYLSRLKQVEIGFSQNESGLIEIISPATVPLTASYPRKGLIISFGFLVSLGIGIFLVLFSERLDSGFRNEDQVERLTNCPVVGTVPRLPMAEKNGGFYAESILNAPESPYGEAVRSLRTGLAVSNDDHPPRLILFASALPGEGKTSLAVSVARQSALSVVNGKVLIIDCDLRRPTIAGMLQLRVDAGLAELFAGEITFEDVIKVDRKTGLHVLPVLPGTRNPPELLNSQNMRDLLKRLSAEYEMVIIDSPALETIADAQVLAHFVDTTLFVVQYESTPRHVVQKSLKQLVNVGANIAGVVLHKVDRRKQAEYAYHVLQTR